MKRTIITILAIVIVAALYLLLATRDINDVLVYPGAELIMLESTDFGTLRFYASGASLLQIAEFYEESPQGLKRDDSFEFGYRLYDPGLVEFMEEVSVYMSDEEIISWVKDNEGVIAELYLLSSDIALMNESLQLHREKIEGKNVISLFHF